MGSKKPYDDAFKDMAEHASRALLELIGALPPGARIMELLPREVSAQALLPDQPYKIEFAGEARVAHLEAERRYKAEILPRVVGYQTRLWLDHRLPVYTYILILAPEGMPPEPRTQLTIEAGWLSVTARCEFIRLWELSAKAALALGDENLLPMIPLMNGGEEELRQGVQALRQVADQDRRQQLSANFAALGSLRYRKSALLELLLGGGTMLITPEILRETPLFQELLEEMRDEVTDQARRQVYAQVREEVRSEVRDEVRSEVRDEVRSEVRDEVRSEVRDEVRSEVRDEVRDEVRSEVRDEVRSEVRAEARRTVIEMASRLAERRFPGAAPFEEIELIRSLDRLEQLVLELDEFSDSEAFRRRILDLAAVESDSARMD
jgi:hypothetical protein